MSNLKVGDLVSIVNTNGLTRIIDTSCYHCCASGVQYHNFNKSSIVEGIKFKVIEVKSNGLISLYGVFGKSFNREDLKKIETKRRMANLEVAKWVAKGNGQSRLNCDVYSRVQYDVYKENEECDVGIKIRKWDTTEWIEPEIEL